MAAEAAAIDVCPDTGVSGKAVVLSQRDVYLKVFNAAMLLPKRLNKQEMRPARRGGAAPTGEKE